MSCCLQNASSSGTRAMEPSSFITSQMTAAGFRPARRARSIPPSVWPARTRTPPSRARRGNTWPGRARSLALALSAIATRIVCGAVGGADARADPLGRIDADRKRRSEAGRVVDGLRVQPQRVASLRGHRQADQTPAESRHEVDDLRRDLLRRTDQIPLIFTVFRIHQDDHLALPEVFQHRRDVAELLRCIFFLHTAPIALQMVLPDIRLPTIIS